MTELDLFVAAVAITDPAERAAFLDRECAGNAPLRHRLDALLAGNEQSRHPLDHSPVPPVAALPADATAAFGGASDPPPTATFGAVADSLTADYPGRDEQAGAVIGGKYTLVEPIGEGGMGSVWRAKQTEPVKRFVAVKLIKAGMDSRQVLARFDAERQALALMDHPNIAKVFDAGATPDGRPFFVMELVKGIPITDYCDAGKLTPRERLELFVPVCQAIQHAHQKGIIHRDIKPSNVLIALYDDRPVVKVIDFGVAKATGAALTEHTIDTGFGGVVGTPQYMSPEQATFNNLDIDTRSDVYALGVLLYELLAGSPPFSNAELKKKGLLEILRVVREEEPPRPSLKLSTADALPTISANRGTEPKKMTGLLRNELDWVVMKALEKDRARRYETANAFAADVQRYLSGEAVQAHPPSAAYRLKKFVRRNKGRVVAASLVLFALLGGIAGTTLGLIEARQQGEHAKEQERIARNESAEKEKARAAEAERVTERDAALKAENERADELKHRLGVSSMLLAGSAYDNRDVYLAAERLAQVPADQRGWDWRYLKQQTGGGLFTLYGHKGPVTCVAFSPDGTRIISGAGQQLQSGEVKVWDARTGTSVVDLKGLPTLYGPSPVKNVAISPDGTRIITGGERNTAIVCDARTGNVLLELKGHTTQVESMAFSPDGSRIVTGGSSQPRTLGGGRLYGKQGPGEVKIWDARTGAALLELKGHTGSVGTVSFSPDGARIATGGGDFDMPDETKVWDTTSGKAVLELNGTGGLGNTVSFSPDGTRIVVGNSASAKVVDVRTGATLLELKVRTRRGPGGTSVGSSVNAAFSPDGTRIVTAGGDSGEATVWDAKTGTALLELTGHIGAVMSVAFSPDGTRIVTGSADGTIKVWDARTGSGRLELAGHRFEVNSAAFSPDGARIVTGSGEFGKPGAATVWDANSGFALVELKGFKGMVSSVSFSEDGARIVTGGGLSGAGEAIVWDAQTGKKLLELNGLKEIVHSAAFSPDGVRIVTGSKIEGPGEEGTEVKMWDSRTGKILHDLSETPIPKLANLYVTGWSVAFSPDGTRIVAGGGRNSKGIGDRATVWDARSGKVLLELTNNKKTLSVSFSPDGQRILTGNADATATVWDASTGNLLLELKGHQGAVTSAAFSPDGTRIVTGGADRTVKVWDVRTGMALVELKGHAAGVNCVSFNRDGTRIVSAGGVHGKLGEAMVWDARPVTDPLKVKAPAGVPDNVIFSPDGSRIAFSSHEGSVAIGDTQTGAVLHNLTGYKGAPKIAFSSDGSRIVAADNSAAKVWDARTGKTLLELKMSQGRLDCLAFSPDGTRIVFARYRTVAPNEPTPETTVWDAQTGEKLFELKGQADLILRVSFSSDSSRIVAERYAIETKVWDAKTGQELPGEAIPKTDSNDQISRDGRLLANVRLDRVELISLKPDAEEIEHRRIHMQPNFGRYREGYLMARAAKDDFAAKFYLKLVPPADQKTLVAKADLDALGPLSAKAQEHLQAMKPELAVPLLIEMINVQKAALGPDDSSTLETMTRLGVVYWQLRQLDKSVPVFEEVLKGQVAKNGRDHLDSFRAMANLGVNYRDAGKLKEAIPLLEEAQLATKKYPELEYVTGKLLEAYEMAGENDKLVKLLEDRVNAMKGKVGPQDPALLDALSNLGAGYWRLRKLDKSIPLFEEVLKNRAAKLGREDVQTLQDAANLGVNYRDAGKLKESIALLEEVHRATKKYPDLRWVTSELIEAYKRTNEFDKAINLMQENLAEARKTLPKDSPQLAGLLAQTVLVLLEQKKWTVAEPLIRECLAIREKAQPDAWQTFNSKAQLGAVLLGQKKYADAEPLLLAGYEGMKQREKTIPPPGLVRIPDALDRLIELYAATSKPDEAKKWRAERAKYPTPKEVAPPPREKK